MIPSVWNFNNSAYVQQFHKSCKASITFSKDNKNYWLSNTELIRYSNIDPTTKQDNYVKNILSEFEQLYKVTPKALGSEESLYVGVTSLHNVSRVIEYTGDSNNLPDEFKQYVNGQPNQPTFQCRVKAESEEKNKVLFYPAYFVDNILNTPSREQAFYLAQNANDFFYEDEHVRILPDFVKYEHFHTHYIEEWNKLKSMLADQDVVNKKSIITKLLSHFTFVVFLKDPNVTSVTNLNNYTYSSLFKLNNDAGKAIMEAVRNSIKTFLLRNFYNMMDVEDDMIDAYVNADTKYKFVVIHFRVVEPGIDNHYFAFSDFLRTVRLSTFIEILSNKTDKDEVSYFTRIAKEKANDQNCGDSIPYKFYKENRGLVIPREGGDITYNQTNMESVSTNLLSILGGNAENVTVLQEYAEGNPHHTYCSEYLLVQIGKNVYHISIKSITYKVLQHNIITGFRDMFTSKFMNSIANNDKKISYAINDANQTVYFTKLPAVIEVYVKKVGYSTFKIPLVTHIKETAEQYWGTRGVLESIKQNTIPISIVLYMVWKREIIKVAFAQRLSLKDIILLENFTKLDESIRNHPQVKQIHETTQLLLKHPTFSLYILEPHFFNKNFVLCGKMTENNLDFVACLAYLLQSSNLEIPYEKLTMIVNKFISKGTLYYRKAFEKNSVIPKDIVFNKSNAHMLYAWLMEYLKDNMRVWVMWYLPDTFKITNYSKFNELVGRLTKDYNEYVNPNSFTDLDTLEKIQKINIEYEKEMKKGVQLVKYRKYVEGCTNFYDVYKRDDFIYNLRHFNRRLHVDEINDLLYQLYGYQVNVQKCEPYSTSIVHYPNMQRYSIFHLQILHRKYGKKDDMLGHQVNQFIERAYNFENFVSIINTQNKTFIIPVIVKGTQISKEIKEKICKELVDYNRGILCLP